MNQPKISLTEMLAEHIADSSSVKIADVHENFAEYLGEIINENLPENVEMTDSEWGSLMTHLKSFVEDDLSDDAATIVNEWNEDTRDYEETKRSAMYG